MRDQGLKYSALKQISINDALHFLSEIACTVSKSERFKVYKLKILLLDSACKRLPKALKLKNSSIF